MAANLLKHIKSLSLRHNEIGDSEVTAIAAALPQMTQLHSLLLGGNNIGDAKREALIAAFPKITFRF